MANLFFLIFYVIPIALIGGYQSQTGQDQYVHEAFFKNVRDGVFVDIGAYDGITFSNTYFFEKDLGWKGLCVEPIPQKFKELEECRDCFCINGCIANQDGEEDFLYVAKTEKTEADYHLDMLSGLKKNYDSRRLARVQRELVAHHGQAVSITTKCFLLNNLLKEKGFYHVNFLSIDTEGGECDILKSIDFKQFIIDVITVENNFKETGITEFLESKGYRVSKHFEGDTVYVRKDFFSDKEIKKPLKETESAKKKTVCLNMIVKDESKVIQRCLASLKNEIDYWVIVDTGSTDKTQEIIKEFMKGVPGELHERPWVDFGHNRQEALTLAKGKGDYILFIDADEEFVYSKEFTQLPLEADYYSAPISTPGENPVVFHRIMMINNRFDWMWKDSIHEFLVVPKEAKKLETMKGVTCMTYSDGGRSEDPRKSYKDAELLEKALQKDPDNPRYTFYLAQSYYNAKEYELAIKYYEKRAAMEMDKEVFWSYYAAASLQQQLGKDSNLYVDNYSKAYESEPARAESLYQLAAHFNRSKNYLLGYSLTKLANSIPRPKGGLYLVEWIYDYGIDFSMGYSALELGKYDEACALFQKILLRTDLPESVRTQTERNLSETLFKKNLQLLVPAA